MSQAQRLAERAFATFERFIRIEAFSGIVLLIAAVGALVWANSPWAHGYHALWHTPFTIGIGSYQFTESLHFLINDGLMTIFFLVVGMEIRREIHEGALSNMRQAGLPVLAAVGGVVVPALIYLALNLDPVRQHGWAVPTATDIAFAVGVLALLGRGIPGNIRVLLLALAIIDDIIAVLIIAFFYSGGLDYSGFAIMALGLAMVLGLQKIGVGTANAYVLPGVIAWIGLLKSGAHPTLSGVVLGLMTPVVSAHMPERPVDILRRIANEVFGREESVDAHRHEQPLRQLRLAQRELLPPAVRVQMALHPWVAFGIMPIFALANAGVSLGGVDLSTGGAQWVLLGVAIALVLGKPLGVIGVSWLAVRAGLCRLPAGVTWSGICLMGLLAGIGFTMSIFIAMLAFSDESLLSAAKLGVLLGSLVAALLGVAWGVALARRMRSTSRKIAADTSPPASG